MKGLAGSSGPSLYFAIQYRQAASYYWQQLQRFCLSNQIHRGDFDRR
jgi:hypothetical protein